MGDSKDDNAGGWLIALLLFGGGAYWFLSNHNDKPAPPVLAPTIQVASQAPVPVAATVLPASPPLAVVPEKPNYSFREGDIYGYIAAVSEEARKEGKAAGDVVMYRFAGTSGGKYQLERTSAAGGILSTSECARPCVAIKTFDASGVSRVAFNPDSIIGAAFDDALKGRLRPKKPVPRPPIVRIAEPSSAQTVTPTDESVPPAAENVTGQGSY